MKLHVEGFVVEADTTAEAAAKVSRHFGCIADNQVPDAGIAVAHTVEKDPAPAEPSAPEEPDAGTPDHSEED